MGFTRVFLSKIKQEPCCGGDKHCKARDSDSLPRTEVEKQDDNGVKNPTTPYPTYGAEGCHQSEEQKADTLLSRQRFKNRLVLACVFDTDLVGRITAQDVLGARFDLSLCQVAEVTRVQVGLGPPLRQKFGAVIISKLQQG